MQSIAVVGAGYVGLVTGACFAKTGNKVVVVEKDKDKIEELQQGNIPFYEPELNELVVSGVKGKKLIFVETIAEALIEKPRVVFSCVGTPSLPDGSVNLSAVWEVVLTIGNHLNNYLVFVNKSTVPVGSAKKVESVIKDQLKRRGVSVDFDVVSNPEFLKEGSAVYDFFHPDRVILGISSQKSVKILQKLYSPFLIAKKQLLIMDSTSAELTKYAANAMLATRVSFINQLALLADKVGADIQKIKQGIGADRRIGHDFLNAGVGYGGSCFPKDVKALANIGKQHDRPMTLVEEADDINTVQCKLFIDRILRYYDDTISKKRIGIWGLSFKPETDDIRCAPSINILKKLQAKGAKIVAYDPVAMENVRKEIDEKINFASNAKEVLLTCDCLVIVTEWKEFLSFNPKDFSLLRDRVVFDGRNCFDPEAMRLAGITYFCIGRNVYNQYARSSALDMSKIKSYVHRNEII